MASQSPKGNRSQTPVDEAGSDLQRLNVGDPSPEEAEVVENMPSPADEAQENENGRAVQVAVESRSQDDAYKNLIRAIAKAEEVVEGHRRDLDECSEERLRPSLMVQLACSRADLCDARGTISSYQTENLAYAP